MRQPCVSRDHHPALDVPRKIRCFWSSAAPARPHHRVTVANARRDPQEHRYPPTLRNLDCRQREIIRLLRIGRLQHGHPGRHRVMPVVLFVLAGGHPGIIRRHHHQRGIHTRIGGGEKRVRCDVEPDVFHRSQRPRSGESRADGHFERYLLVGGPLRVSAKLGKRFQDFSGGCAGVTRPQRHAGVPGSQRDRFVAA